MQRLVAARMRHEFQIPDDLWLVEDVAGFGKVFRHAEIDQQHDPAPVEGGLGRMEACLRGPQLNCDLDSLALSTAGAPLFARQAATGEFEGHRMEGCLPPGPAWTRPRNSSPR